MPNNLPWKRIEAEFLAITAGISLGLLGDDYRQYRNDRQAEQESLQLLAQDLERDLDRLMFTRGWLELQANAAVLLRCAATGVPIPQDSLESTVATLAFTATYDRQQTPFLSPRDGGDLRLIQESQLRSDLTDYHEISQVGIEAFVTDYRIAHLGLRDGVTRHVELFPMPEFDVLWPLPEELDFARVLSPASSWRSDTSFWNEPGEVGARCFELLDEFDKVIEENRVLYDGIDAAIQ
jgi:hypothetical protein